MFEKNMEPSEIRKYCKVILKSKFSLTIDGTKDEELDKFNSGIESFILLVQSDNLTKGEINKELIPYLLTYYEARSYDDKKMESINGYIPPHKIKNLFGYSVGDRFSVPRKMNGVNWYNDYWEHDTILKTGDIVIIQAIWTKFDVTDLDTSGGAGQITLECTVYKPGEAEPYTELWVNGSTFSQLKRIKKNSWVSDLFKRS